MMMNRIKDILKENCYKIMFCIVLYILFILAFVFSDITTFSRTVLFLMIFNMGIHYCYGFIFNTKIFLPAATLQVKKHAYLRFVVFFLGVILVISILFDMSGIYDFYN